MTLTKRQLALLVTALAAFCHLFPKYEQETRELVQRLADEWGK